MKFLSAEPATTAEAARLDLFEHVVKGVARFLTCDDTSLRLVCNPGTILDEQPQTHEQSDRSGNAFVVHCCRNRGGSCICCSEPSLASSQVFPSIPGSARAVKDCYGWGCAKLTGAKRSSAAGRDVRRCIARIGPCEGGLLARKVRLRLVADREVEAKGLEALLPPVQ